MKLKPGFNPYIPNEVYHADTEYVSSSVLKTVNKGLEAYKNQYIDGNRQMFANQDALDFGSYLHALVLEPHLVDEEFAVFDGDFREGEAYEEFEVSNKGKVILTRSQGKFAKELLENFYRTGVTNKEGEFKLLNTFFIGGEAEETLCVKMDGVKVKVRFDYRKSDKEGSYIADIKTTSSKIRSRRDVEKVCKSWEYDLSAALYVDAVERATGIKHDFYFCFLSKDDKGSTLWKASEEFLERGRKKYKEALKKLKQARKTGLYFDGIPEVR